MTIKPQIIQILFSLLLFPMNIGCAFWLFTEALHLTGMTVPEFVEKNMTQMPQTGRHRRRRMWRFWMSYFQEHSTDPQKSIWLMRAFGICTLPGLVALCLAACSAMQENGLPYTFWGDILLAGINIALAIWGRVYKKTRSHKTVVIGRIIHIKSIIVYAFVGALFFGILFLFMMGIVGLMQSPPTEYGYPSAISIQAELITILQEKGYETANVPTTYWQIDEHKLEHIAAGVKDDCKFEFYGYSDAETVNMVYQQIVYGIAPTLENEERESYEITLPEEGKLFQIEIDSVHYLTLYRNDTVIYAYASTAPDEIYVILQEIGYLPVDEY